MKEQDFVESLEALVSSEVALDKEIVIIHGETKMPDVNTANAQEIPTTWLVTHLRMLHERRDRLAVVVSRLGKVNVNLFGANGALASPEKSPQDEASKPTGVLGEISLVNDGIHKLLNILESELDILERL